jgi:hypothetical protein
MRRASGSDRARHREGTVATPRKKPAPAGAMIEMHKFKVGQIVQFRPDRNEIARAAEGHMRSSSSFIRAMAVAASIVGPFR